MTIRVEFYGIPRQRAGVAEAEVPVQGTLRLRELLAQLAERYPKFAAECLADDGLRPGYVANINGQQFVRASEARLQDNICLLIMSADAGG
jgi:hypothetical protein